MRTISLFDVAQGLSKVRWRGDRKFSACCPAHDDRNPSFHASEVDRKILVKCFAGCSQDEVISALRGQELWPQTDTKSRQPARVSKDAIWRHQMLLATELARAKQGFNHTEEEQEQIKQSSQFLEAHGYGLE
jgi:hypothetical protein